MSTESTPVTESMPVKIFCSYAIEDEKWLRELEMHMSLLKWQGKILFWHRRLVSLNADWKQEIDAYLKEADIILLLVSADFIGSDYCYSTEMTRAMERHDRGEAVVIPVLLRSCVWKESRFGKLQALPTNTKPVTSWPNQDEAFSNVAEGIQQKVTQLISPPEPPVREPPTRSWPNQDEAFSNVAEGIQSPLEAPVREPPKRTNFEWDRIGLDHFHDGDYEKALWAWLMIRPEQLTRKSRADLDNNKDKARKALNDLRKEEKIEGVYQHALYELNKLGQTEQAERVKQEAHTLGYQW